MKSRVLWTVTAIGLVVSWVAARLYIGDLLKDGYAIQQPVSGPPTPGAAVSSPAPEAAEPSEPAPSRGPVHFAPLAERFDRVHRLARLGAPVVPASEDGEGGPSQADFTADRQSLIDDAHAALDEVVALDLEWDPRLTDRTRRQLDALEKLVEGLSPSDPGLQTHLLATRVALMEAAGEPDAERAEQLEQAREYRPDDFSWEK